MPLFVGVLAALALGSLIWTVIQIVRPAVFFRAEYEANLKRERPWWYLAGGVIWLGVLVLLWVQAIQLRLISVWIVTGLLTLGSVKALGVVFFYQRFSGAVTTVVTNMAASRKAYVTTVVMRGTLSLVLGLMACYFGGVFGPVQ